MGIESGRIDVGMNPGYNLDGCQWKLTGSDAVETVTDERPMKWKRLGWNVSMEIDWSDEVETFTDVERTEREWPTEFNSIEIEWTRKTESQDLFGKLKRFKPRDKTLLWK